jgi:general secretion pathway protein D
MTFCKHLLPLALAAAWHMAAAQNAAPAPLAEAADAAASEPRILRGNDQIIAPVKAPPALAGAPISFNFEEAPIAEVVRTILGDLLKVDYVLYPPLNGAVTLSTRAPVTPDKAVFLLESALAVNGLGLVRDARGSYHVGRADALKSVSSGIRQINTTALPPGVGPIIVPLQYIGAGEMAAILRPMLPADSMIRVDTVRNLLILAGTRTQAEGWMEIVNTFDVNLLKGMSVGVFPLKYASVGEVEAACGSSVAREPPRAQAPQRPLPPPQGQPQPVVPPPTPRRPRLRHSAKTTPCSARCACCPSSASTVSW